MREGKTTDTLRSILTWVCRILLGGTFLFSGFVKVADPMGMTHKLHTYLAALNWRTIAEAQLLQEAATTALGTLEFVLGASLLLGIRRKFTAQCTLLFTLAFTLLTIWVYAAAPVADCGCFGDAVTLTNGQTLFKNILLLAASLWFVSHWQLTRRIVSERHAWIGSIYSWVYALALALYSLHYLPVIEFTPYIPGADIRAVFEGKENGKQDMRLANFYLYSPQDEEKDYTMEVLADTGYTFLLTLPDATKADDGSNDRINDLYDFARDNDIPFYMATASLPPAIAGWIDRTGAAYPVLMAEDTELKAMARSNPGLLLLHDGKVAAKWSCNNLPEPGKDVQATLAPYLQRSGFPLLKLILWFAVPLALLIIVDNLWVGRIFYRHHIYIQHFKLKKIMRKKIVAGNWKMNKNLQEGAALAKELNEVLEADKPSCQVIICTPYIHLATVNGLINPDLIGLGAENCADKASGAYTGEVSAEMVKSTGAQYVILGHSERRAYYHETPAILKEKVNLALSNGLKVIFCIGEVLEEREAGKQNEVVKAQIEGSLFDLTPAEFSHIILAYEPVWAIGTGKTATADQAEEMHAFIRKTIAGKFGAEAAEDVSILYGGSCKPGNAAELFSKPDVDGGLIGGAALKAADFKGIIDAWKK